MSNQYQNETKNCQNCKKDFTIEPDDFTFYDKIKVPPPTWCPDCRFQRRLMFLNWTTLYKRKCDKCSKDIVSIHHRDTPFKVYCSPCWWADDWDGTEYATDYDPRRNFFEQMIELRNKSVFMGLENLHPSLVDTPYSNATAYQKNCFMVFNADYGERNAYSTMYANLTESMDTFRMKSSELCYECVGIYKSYKCFYSEELDSCCDVYFSRNLSGCVDCFGCINLRNKSYYIFNQQYSKEEYREKIKEFQIDTIDGVEKMRKIAYDFWMQNPQRSTIGNSMNVNTIGDMVYESKNAKNCYMVSMVEDSRYIQLTTIAPVKDCYDYTVWGYGAEKLYECLTVGEGAYNSHFCVQCWPASIENEYCLYTNQSKNCFGCINLKKKQYCILNKEYTKEEYEVLKNKIIEDLKNNPYIDNMGRVWSYGEMMPIDLSPYSYNETVAIQFYPMDKKDVINNGFTWHEIEDSNFAVSIKVSDLPKDANGVDDSILTEIIACGNCEKPYKITDAELYLIKKMGLPLPTWCWKCRHSRRFERINGFKLYERQCDKCSNPISTSYAPDRPEIVYCEKCYQQEII